MAEANLAAVQGFVIRTYAMPALRVFNLRVGDSRAARAFIGSLVSGGAGLQVTTAQAWTVKPDACVNIALTHAGLRALGLDQAALASFPEEFAEGALARAGVTGDTAENAPEHWKAEFTGPDLHAQLFLFAQSAEIRERAAAELRSRFTAGGGMAELSAYDGNMLPDELAHFGYRDGFSQPSIEGGPAPVLPTSLPAAPLGEFVLGYESQFDQYTYPVPQFGQDGSFVAFRMLEQDCAAFDRFLNVAPAKYGISGELLAAKVCGRWRNGLPIELSPETDTPNPALPLEQYNQFDYAGDAANPGVFDDRKGYRCPAGAHIRRMNPRSSRVAGGGGLKRRIVRRGLPYGPVYDPAHPDDGKERGLLGLFIGVSLKDQFEFLMKDWANKDQFAPGISGTKDVILGGVGEGEGRFTIPREGQQPLTISGFSQFVRTRGAAYGFLPGVAGLRALADLPHKS